MFTPTQLKYVVFGQSDRQWLARSWPDNGLRVKRLEDAGRFTREELDNTDKFRTVWWNSDDLIALLAPEFATSEARYIIADLDPDNDSAYLTGISGDLDEGDWAFEWSNHADGGMPLTLDQARRIMEIQRRLDGDHDSYPETAAIAFAHGYLPDQLPVHKAPEPDLSEYEKYSTTALGKAALDIFASAEQSLNDAAKGAAASRDTAVLEEAAKMLLTEKPKGAEVGPGEVMEGLDASRFERWVDDFGQEWNVHAEALCQKPCGIHAPSFHSLAAAPRAMANAKDEATGRETILLHRHCEHGVFHPDADDKLVGGKPWLYPHDCCTEKCCWSEEMREG